MLIPSVLSAQNLSNNRKAFIQLPLSFCHSCKDFTPFVCPVHTLLIPRMNMGMGFTLRSLAYARERRKCASYFLKIFKMKCVNYWGDSVFYRSSGKDSLRDNSDGPFTADRKTTAQPILLWENARGKPFYKKNFIIMQTSMRFNKHKSHKLRFLNATQSFARLIQNCV